MSKMSRSLLQSMDRFAIDGYAAPGDNGNGARRFKPRAQEHIPTSRYAAAARS